MLKTTLVLLLIVGCAVAFLAPLQEEEEGRRHHRHHRHRHHHKHKYHRHHPRHLALPEGDLSVEEFAAEEDMPLDEPLFDDEDDVALEEYANNDEEDDEDVDPEDMELEDDLDKRRHHCRKHHRRHRKRHHKHHRRHPRHEDEPEEYTEDDAAVEEYVHDDNENENDDIADPEEDISQLDEDEEEGKKHRRHRDHCRRRRHRHHRRPRCNFNVTAQNSFDGKLDDGEWFLDTIIAKREHREHLTRRKDFNLTCISSKVKAIKDRKRTVLRSVTTASFQSEKRQFNITVRSRAHSTKQPATFRGETRFRRRDARRSIRFDERIIDTDYKTYAMIYVCDRPDGRRFRGGQRVVILSRTPKLEAADRTMLINKLSSKFGWNAADAYQVSKSYTC